MIDDGDLDWEDIRAFLATARSGSLTAAARRLRLSPPTLGRRPKRLEDALGGPLFDRLPNRLELTALGRSVLDGAAAMGDAAAAFARHADRHAERSSASAQPVRVTATTSVSAFLILHLPELLGETGADLTILSTRSALNLAQREADIALRMDRVPAEGDLVTRRLGGFAFTLYAARGLRDDWSGRWDGAPVVGLPETRRRPSQAGWLDDTVRDRGGRIVARLSELPMRLDAARRGLGLTLLPCVLGDAEPALVRVVDPPAALSEDVHLLVHRDRRDAPAVAAVVEALVRLFRRHAAALAGH
ncbi:LysR family transcriptional regulator [Azospirillum sp. YIM B02556]|uniref:LysR family transcriptional regulator n=1 Tax=Azospirillum endophyticum TaxID=2800326 RepID=A0ABS1F393_9PROT|nr:LysR family transcriptional regulator [Azospirillum endophyticum]MBK1837882.1 LysR family transcriptional regulator [Azospirillum endophyticum]